jgi:hypothetical protein
VSAVAGHFAGTSRDYPRPPAVASPGVPPGATWPGLDAAQHKSREWQAALVVNVATCSASLGATTTPAPPQCSTLRPDQLVLRGHTDRMGQRETRALRSSRLGCTVSAYGGAGRRAAEKLPTRAGRPATGAARARLARADRAERCRAAGARAARTQRPVDEGPTCGEELCCECDTGTGGGSYGTSRCGCRRCVTERCGVRIGGHRRCSTGRAALMSSAADRRGCARRPRRKRGAVSP